MERFFVFDKFNTYYDWDLILTGKDVTPPDPKTNYVELDGMSGSLDLSESLTGEVVYKDRIITATFWTDVGSRTDRVNSLQTIIASLHGRKVKIIEPDDPSHYFYGRVSVKTPKNTKAYLEFTVEAVCEPWRYALTDTTRRLSVNSLTATDMVIRNHGTKTLTPEITVTGNIMLEYEGATITLTAGTYKIPDIKLHRGANIIGVSGTGSVAITYREAYL